MKKHEKILDGDRIVAIILRDTFSKQGTSFFTPGEFSQQMGLLIHDRGKVVERHRHKLVKREILRTQEVLVILKGRIRIELYNDAGEKLKAVILSSGDSILLAGGGHRITFLEKSRLIEVKQGPYAGYDDKEFF